MKKGTEVTFRIVTYPYERTGTIIGREDGRYIVKVQYNSKFMIFRKRGKELTETKKIEKTKKTLDNCD